MRKVSVLRKEEGGRPKTTLTHPKKSLVQMKKKEMINKGDNQPKKAPFSFVICYNCGGKGYTRKSSTSASRAVFKKIERKAKSMEKGKKRVKIIDEDGFTKVVNTQSTSSPTPGPAPKTPIPEPRIVELKSDCDEIKEVKVKMMVEKVEKDGWKVKGPLTGPSRW